MASTLGLQSTFALGTLQRRRSHVRLSPAKTRVLRPTSRLFRGLVCSSSSVASCSPPEGQRDGKASAAVELQALAVAAACAVGASVFLSRAAAMPSVFPSRKLDTITIGSTMAPAPTSAGEEPGTSRAGKTQLLLEEILFGRKGTGTECEDPCKKLVDHAFAILPWDDQLRFLEQITQGKITRVDIGKHEEYEIQIAMVQIYLAMHKYDDAKKLLQLQKDIIENDGRIYLLQAVVHMMLAIEKMSIKTTTTTTEEDKEIKDLIVSAKESWDNFEKIKDLQNEPEIKDLQK